MSEQTGKPKKPVAHPRRRRVLFAINTALAALVALAVVVAINFVAYRQFMRFDFTELGVYSLSPQTRQVLDDLDAEHEIVTLFSTDFMTAGRQRVRDLIDEYDRRSPQITVTHIDPNVDIARFDAFAARVRDRYADEVEPVREAVEQARGAYTEFTRAIEPVLARLRQVLDRDDLPAGQSLERIRGVFSVLRQAADSEEAFTEQVASALDQPLPNYRNLLSTLEGELSRINDQILPTAVQWFTQAADDEALPGEAQENLLRAVETLEALRDPVRDATVAAREAETPEGYSRLRRDLAGGGAVVVLGPAKARVIAEDEMFLQLDPQMAEQMNEAIGEVETRFLGEERLTGALVSLQLEQPPMVVFINSPRGRALGERGRYSHVASRLESLNIDVREWSPSGQQTPWGGMSPPQPPPQPAEGQKAVWVVLPQPPANPGNPMQPGGGGAEQVAELVSQRIDAGDSVMMMLSVQAGMMLPGPDPIADLAGAWGVMPRTDRLLVHEVNVGERRTAAQPTFEVTQWPEATRVTQALGGMIGRFVAPAPVITEDVEGVTTFPLVAIGQDRTWAIDAADITSQRDLMNQAFDPESAEDRYTVAVAAERSGSGEATEDEADAVAAEPGPRLAVFNITMWADDQLTTYGVLPGMGGGPGLADIAGAAFPANAELFVNTTLWLSDLEELIATSPRVQKARRVEAVDDRTRAIVVTAIVAGVPVASLLLGMGVYLVRRRG